MCVACALCASVLFVAESGTKGDLEAPHQASVVWCGVVWCGVVWCGVPKALLPKGKGRDVYPRVQVNGLGCVCCVRAVCKCVVA